MRRDWTDALAKVDEEGVCRACGSSRRLEAAHIIPRSRVVEGGEDPRNIIPLCVSCHADQHAGILELLPILTLDEQSYAVSLVGIADAYRRTTSARAAA